MRYKHEAKITVAGRFPLDMLRYDCCYPATERDSGAMENYPHNEARTVTVCKITDSKVANFTPARWQSFGCEIDVLPVRKI